MGNLLEVDNLCLEVQTPAGWLPVVQDLSFTLEPGQILGVVGESGSGKSLTALALAGLLPGSVRVRSGAAIYKGQTIWNGEQHGLKQALRGTEIAIIFQNALTSLSPTLKIGIQMTDGLRSPNKRIAKSEAKRRALALLDQVGIREPARVYNDYPHRLSGGMQQRVLIAAAMMGNPSLLIADEPTTALDVRIQAQIMEVFRQLQAQTGLAIILISHDLSLIGTAADRVLVLYAGQGMELADRSSIIFAPAHPYTSALLQATPALCARFEELAGIPGAVPSVTEALPGCAFYPRCARRKDTCTIGKPPLRILESGSGGRHWVRCRHPLRNKKIGGIRNA